MKGEDRRNFLRRQIDLAVRFISRADLEAAGRVEDISEGGLRMRTNAAAEIGDEVIAYPEGLGRLTGKVVRKDANGVSIEFDISDNQREHLSKRIASALSGVPYVRILDKRMHNRVDMNVRSNAENLVTGDSFDCEIINFSPTGAALRSSVRPALGADIKIGTMRGKVSRLMEDGFAIQFLKRAVA